MLALPPLTLEPPQLEAAAKKTSTMWHLCIAGLALTLLVFVAFLADALNDFSEIPGFQADWAWVFLPIIVYLAVAIFVTASHCWSAVYFTGRVRRATATGGGSTNGDDKYPLEPEARAHAIQIDKNIAWISFVESLFDTALIACGIVFVVLTINALDTAQVLLITAAADESESSDSTDESTFSFLNASIPLVVIWLLLSLMALLAAWRTNSEYSRALRADDNDIDSESWCCGGGSSDAPDYRSSAVKEKGVYTPTAGFQEWPCAFMFNWSLGYGWPDSVLAILLFLALPAMVLVTLMFAHFLDTGGPSMTSTFIVLWILESLIIGFALLAFFWMLCCAWMPIEQPRGRSGRMVKGAELFIVLVTAVLLAVQQILIAVRVDDADPLDWNVVFIPFYVLLGFAAFAACASGRCCITPAQPASSAATPGSTAKYGQTPKKSAWGLASELANQ